VGQRRVLLDLLEAEVTQKSRGIVDRQDNAVVVLGMQTACSWHLLYQEQANCSPGLQSIVKCLAEERKRCNLYHVPLLKLIKNLQALCPAIPLLNILHIVETSISKKDFQSTGLSCRIR